MSDTKTKLIDLLKEQHKDQMLTKEMLDQINETIKLNEALTKVVDVHKDTVRAKNALIKDQGECLTKLTAENGVLLGKLTCIEAREAKMLELELTAKHEAQRVEDHISMVGLVLRNPITQESITKQAITAIPGSRDCVGYVDKQEVTGTTTKEQK